MKPSVVVGLGPHQTVGGSAGFITGGGSGDDPEETEAGTEGLIAGAGPEETGVGVRGLHERDREHKKRTTVTNSGFNFFIRLMYPSPKNLLSEISSSARFPFHLFFYMEYLISPYPQGRTGRIGRDDNRQNIGWGTRIRTSVGGVRVHSPAARRSPNIRARYLGNRMTHSV